MERKSFLKVNYLKRPDDILLGYVMHVMMHVIVTKHKNMRTLDGSLVTGRLPNMQIDKDTGRIDSYMESPISQKDTLIWKADFALNQTRQTDTMGYCYSLYAWESACWYHLCTSRFKHTFYASFS